MNAPLRFLARDTMAPIVPDELLDELGRAFVSYGGQRLLGITFEQYVRDRARERCDPRAHLRAALRNAIDRRTTS